MQHQTNGEGRPVRISGTDRYKCKCNGNGVIQIQTQRQLSRRDACLPAGRPAGATKVKGAKAGRYNFKGLACVHFSANCKATTRKGGPVVDQRL